MGPALPGVHSYYDTTSANLQAACISGASPTYFPTTGAATAFRAKTDVQLRRPWRDTGANVIECGTALTASSTR